LNGVLIGTELELELKLEPGLVAVFFKVFLDWPETRPMRIARLFLHAQLFAAMLVVQ
jgi:hypothetical protein